LIEGRWKLVIIFHLFGHGVLRFSELERAIVNTRRTMTRPLKRASSLR
jgi:DNA-binding HxlR family transcriptional regulator